MNKEKKILDPSLNNLDKQDNYLNCFINDEIKSLQKSIAMQQQTLYKILNLLESLRANTHLGVIGGL